MLKRLPLTTLLLACVATLCLTLASIARAKAVTPTISAISPSTLKIGQKLTIRGRNFVPGKLKNTVVFLRARARPLFVKADSATSTRITVTVPEKLIPFLATKAGKPVNTRFQLRVLARRFGASFTAQRLSPVIGPSDSNISQTVPGCKPDYSPGSQKDSDGDGLTDLQERVLKLDPCKPDTDGDGVSDGFEYYSALDLNGKALPYPGKRPYPNALDPTDANTDYDGDGLTNADEYAAWVRYGGAKFPLNYSDGSQNTGGVINVGPNNPLDLNGDGKLTDDERDVDNDGLGNWVEAHGPLSGQAWWTAIYDQEKPYKVDFAGTDWLDPDTDGDTLPDGQDDQDFDGYNNASEVVRGPYWVQPFNPCLPDPYSRSCSLHPPKKDSWPPFGSFTPGESIPLVWPRP